MGFIFLAFALLAVVIWLIAPVLFAQRIDNFDNNKQLNINIAKERITELEAQLTSGEIDQNQYDQMRNEIESSLLDDTDEHKNTQINTELPVHYKRNVLILLTAIPFCAFALYQYWGAPEVLTKATAGSAQTDTNQTANPHDQQNKHAGGLGDAIKKLEARLASEPNNPDGWYMLARSYVVQKQFTKASESYRKLYALVGDQPAVLLGLADTLTMSHNGDMSGEPFELAKKALAIEPSNPTALWLTGLGYQDNGELAKAIELWQKLLPHLTEQPQSSQEVRTLIDRAQRQLGNNVAQTNTAVTPTTKPNPMSQSNQTATAKLLVSVQIDSALRATVSDSDYVMVYAQRVSGMKMPLAIIKTSVKDLPITVTLDDSQSVGPMGKLSDAAQVYVLARISKSGQAIRQSGDIEVKAGPFPNNYADPIEIKIK